MRVPEAFVDELEGAVAASGRLVEGFCAAGDDGALRALGHYMIRLATQSLTALRQSPPIPSHGTATSPQ